MYINFSKKNGLQVTFGTVCRLEVFQNQERGKNEIKKISGREGSLYLGYCGKANQFIIHKD